MEAGARAEGVAHILVALQGCIDVLETCTQTHPIPGFPLPSSLQSFMMYGTQP